MGDRRPRLERRVLSGGATEQHGFRVVGARERIALMGYGPLAGTWRDTGLIERRRSGD
ncbi:hypothetical protein [Agromyces larvae]|uniref:hypothetical protein n=1 Tax=Agromyces larvae TaxID=2929802 RepID=UPI003F49668F